MTLNQIIRDYKGSFSKYEEFTDDLAKLLKKLIKKSEIKYLSVNSRVKEENRLVDKITRPDKNYSKLSDITDISGVRIITYFEEDVDKIGELIEDQFIIDEANSIDKRKLLDHDRFGYLSNHFVIQLNPERLELDEYKAYKNLKTEIQIRSILQHAWAEIEHDLGYTGKDSIPEKVRRSFSRIASLLEIADIEFIRIRNELSEYEIALSS